MKRLRRWLPNALYALSLLLCVVVIVLWVRSYSLFPPFRLGDRWVFSHGQNALELRSFQGRISLQQPTKSVPAVSINGVWYFSAVSREYFDPSRRGRGIADSPAGDSPV